MAGAAEITRARVRAICSQVQASVAVVEAEAFEARRDRPLVAGGPQTHIDFVQHAFACARREARDQPLNRCRGQIEDQHQRRAAQVSSMFDVPAQEKVRLEWHGDLPIEAKPWNVG